MGTTHDIPSSLSNSNNRHQSHMPRPPVVVVRHHRGDVLVYFPTTIHPVLVLFATGDAGDKRAKTQVSTVTWANEVQREKRRMPR